MRGTVIIEGDVCVDTGATAQDAYRLMLREYISPALRELGFRRGPSLGAFRYETATRAAEVRFRKSRGSTKQKVSFWAEMHTSDIKTEWVYWDQTLDGIRPWVVETDSSVEQVANEVLCRFRSDGWPAIQSALNRPTRPQTC